MIDFIVKRWHGLHILMMLFFSFLLISYITYIEALIGSILFVIWGSLVVFNLRAEKSFRNDLERFVLSLSYQINEIGEDAFNEWPIGIIHYDEHMMIKWHNTFITSLVERELIGESLVKVYPFLAQLNEKSENSQLQWEINGSWYEFKINIDKRLIYVQNITPLHKLQTAYDNEQLVMMIFHVDNFDETVQGLDDQAQSILLSTITGILSEWTTNKDIFLRRFSIDKYLGITTMEKLREIEKEKFDVLDLVREMGQKSRLPLTLSIGVSSGNKSLIELAKSAQSAIDIALGRGGDQVTVKKGDKLDFYGGKSNTIDKRNRVKARMISHALRGFILESEQVFIMGHKQPDLDALGAAIGVLKIAQINGKEGYIVLEEINPEIEKLVNALRDHETLLDRFITPDLALSIVNENSLIVVVDTHKPSKVIEERLLQDDARVIVIDHHRRSEEFIHDPILTYLEPYASSTCELVTELLQYQLEKSSLSTFEATALLSGIILDTKKFSLNTSTRTFDVASFLRKSGADNTLAHQLLKEEIDHTIKQAELIKLTQILNETIAITMSEKDKLYDQIVIAKTADSLLNMNGIHASFVICERSEGTIAISARSNGSLNVQLIMEKLGGGGHLTNAATQIKGMTLQETYQKLIGAIEQYKIEMNQEKQK